MSLYEDVERDFIERSLRFVERHSQHVQDNGSETDTREVTLLINCLLALIVYPQELAHRLRHDRWLTDETIAQDGATWHLQLSDVSSPGSKWKGPKCDGRWVAIDLETMTIRQLLRQMRNAIAHGNFTVVAKEDDKQTIGYVVFMSKGQNDFCCKLPVARLQGFAQKLAESALAMLDDM